MLPARDVSGLDSPRNAMMKHTEATRYRRAESVSLMNWRSRPLLLLLLELAQHALGDDEAAENVDRGEHHGKETHRLREADLARPGGEQRADDDDARDSVGDRHQG